MYKQNTWLSYFKVFHYSIYKADFGTKGKSACVRLTALQKYSKTNGGKTSRNNNKKRQGATAKEQKNRENRAKSSANALSRNWLFPLFYRKEKNANKFAADKG